MPPKINTNTGLRAILKKRFDPRDTHEILGFPHEGVELFEVTASSESRLIQQTLDQMGLHLTAKEIIDRTDNLSRKLLGIIAQSALDAAKSVVPVDTKDLRDKHIHRTPFARGKNPGSKIYVDNEEHQGRGRKTPVYASSLAEVLNRGSNYAGLAPYLNRRNPSIPVVGTPYSSVSGETRDWIGVAQRQFIRHKGNILRSAMGLS